MENLNSRTHAEDRARPFYRELATDLVGRVRDVVSRLVDWKRWAAPSNDEIDTILAGNKSAVKDWFKAKGLTTGYLIGAPE